MANTKDKIVIFIIFAVSVFSILQIYTSTKTKPQPTFKTQKQTVKISGSNRLTPKEYLGKIVFMGDSMFARNIGSAVQDGQDPYRYVGDKLKTYSLRVANIETTIADPRIATSRETKLYNFNSPLQSLDLLKKHQIDVSNLANNHTSDFGPSATLDMISQFNKRGLNHAGIGKDIASAFKPSVSNIKLTSPQNPKEKINLKVGLISLNDVEMTHTQVSNKRAGGAYFDKSLAKQAISDSKKAGAKVTIVIVHWGKEYALQPNARQKEWGRYFIDAGADAVIGSHPHVIQPTEYYKGKPIVYSLGNFIFDGMSGNALRAQMMELPISFSVIPRLNNSAQKSIKLNKPISVPIQINSQGFPTILK